MGKKEYLQKICDKLNSCGLTEYNAEDLLSHDRQPFSVKGGEVATLRWLPEDNLRRMSEFDISKFKDYQSVYQAWGREGFFKFKPYMVNDKENATLCVRHNRFLHMFRGYYYQISGTPDGEGSYETGMLRTDGFMRMLKHERTINHSHLGFIILYAAMINCAFHNDNFRELFYEDKDAVDDYFRKSMKFWYINFDYGFDVVSQYISYKDGSLVTDECGHQVYYITTKGGVMCRFWCSPEAAEVEYCYDKDNGVGKSKIIRFDIPSAEEGLNLKEIGWWTDDDTNDLYSSFTEACGTHEKIEYFIVLMLLKFVGININYMASYPIKKIGLIRKLDDDKAIEIETFDKVK